jgi:hypothetical protein
MKTFLIFDRHKSGPRINICALHAINHAGTAKNESLSSFSLRSPNETNRSVNQNRFAAAITGEELLCNLAHENKLNFRRKTSLDQIEQLYLIFAYPWPWQYARHDQQ